MQTPTRARRKAEPKREPARKVPPKPRPAAKCAPTIRDDAWWVVRMQGWREARGEDAAMPRGKLKFWLALDVDEKPNDGDPTVPTNLDVLLDRWSAGETMRQLAEHVTALFGFAVSSRMLREAIQHTSDGLAKYNRAREHLAHQLVEQALDEADLASKAGDYRFAADFRLKLAAKMRPEEYGDRTQLEVGGIKGRPIEQVVHQTPADAYKAVLEGGSIAGAKP